MDWKRIMNKRFGKTDRKKAEDAQQAAAKEEIRQFFIRLLPEINLRLLLDMEPEVTESVKMGCDNFVVFSQRLLWLEAVTVTAYQPASAKEQSKKPGFMRIWKRLTKAPGSPCSFQK